MTEFREEARRFENIARAARRLEQIAGYDLVGEAIRLAYDEAKDTLMFNLSKAIAFSGEFQRPELETRLFAFFSGEGILTADTERGIQIHVDPEEAKTQWIVAQQYARESLRQGKSLRGWAANPSPAQRQAYWRNRVYPEYEIWAENIEARFEVLDEDIAPFWYFLEYGTGPGAFPTVAPQRFIQNTMSQVGGFRLVNIYLEQIIKRFEDGATRGLEGVAAGPTGGDPIIIIEQEVRWTEWYTWLGKQRRHQYIPGQGVFKGAKVEIK